MSVRLVVHIRVSLRRYKAPYPFPGRKAGRYIVVRRRLASSICAFALDESRDVHNEISPGRTRERPELVEQIRRSLEGVREGSDSFEGKLRDFRIEVHDSAVFYMLEL